MPDNPGPQSEATPHAGSEQKPGCVLLLIDESTAMNARVAGGTKTKIESIATAINSLLNQFSAEPSIDVALVGYHCANDGKPDIGCRWGGRLAGRRFVSSDQLAESPLAVEERVRKIPAPSGIGVAREEKVRFPVWYAPTLGHAVSRQAAFEYCRQLLADRSETGEADLRPPLIVSFIADVIEQESRENMAQTLQELDGPGGPPIVFHVHLGSSSRIPATLYPSSDTQLPPGPIHDFFQVASALPPPLVEAVGALEVVVNVGARGLIYNASMVDLIRFLSLVKAYARYQPPDVSDTVTSSDCSE